ncbi:MAG: LysM peptidoglycan-binding domain-containing protein [Kiritimatiellae bacterium]|nr:LysM peptidoglycan-binding domain-containing protein [Kiritimatiellia bacterium]
MKLKLMLSLTCCVALLAVMGCNKEDAETVARKERVAALLAEARTAEAQGDAVAAENFYRQLLLVDPTEATAHLSLANLSQDLRKNYLDAMYHYQRYLDLQPDSEKVSLVKDRLASARTLLSNQLAAEIISREQRAIETERDALQTQLRELEKTVRSLNNTIASRDATIIELQGEVKRLTRLVEKLKAAEVETRSTHAAEIAAARKELEDERSKPDLSGTADLVAAAREEAERILEEEDGGVPPKDEALRAIAENAKDETPITTTPTRGKRYVVRPGDTFSALAREAYGNAAEWPRIREANRSSANPNGRLLAGESIYIP